MAFSNLHASFYLWSHVSRSDSNVRVLISFENGFCLIPLVTSLSASPWLISGFMLLFSVVHDALFSFLLFARISIVLIPL